MTLGELQALVPNEGTRGVQKEIAAFCAALGSVEMFSAAIAGENKYREMNGREPLPESSFRRLAATGIDRLLAQVGAIETVTGARNYSAGYKNRRASYSYATVTSRAEYQHALAQLPAGYKPHNPRSDASAQPALEREVAAPVTPRIWTRYRFDRVAGYVWQPCGVACRMKIPTMTREGAAYVRGKDAWYWEHGADVAECETERTRKGEAKLAEIDRENERLRNIRDGERQRRRDERRARLVARLCGAVRVTADDVRAAGACRAGIENWCAAHGVSVEASLALPELARDRQALPYALAIARRVGRG